MTVIFAGNPPIPGVGWKKKVTSGDQGAGGEVTRSLRGRVPDVELETVLRLGGAARSVKLN